MRHRERAETIWPMTGRFFWITGPGSEQNSGSMRYTSVCKDIEHGFGTANPLHSKQVRVSHSRHRVQVYPEGTVGSYRGECGILPTALPTGFPTSVQSAHGWASRGWSAAMSSSITPLSLYVAEGSEGLAYSGSKAGTLSQRIARMWFFVNFGLIPTGSAFIDIVGYDEKVAAETRRILRQEVTPVRVTLHEDQHESESFSSSRIFPWNAGFGFGVSDLETKTVVNRTDKVWFTCQRVLNLPKYITKGERFAYVTAKVTGMKPVSGAYELTPYSWLIDYFVPLGPIINVLEMGALWKVRMPCIMHQTSEVHSLSATPRYVDAYGETRELRMSARVRRTVKRRYPYIAPLPGFIMPSLNTPQLANIAGLLANYG